MFPEPVLKAQFLPFANDLGAMTGLKVDLAYYATYESLLDGLLNDEVDIAYLGPLPYVFLLSNNHPFVPVVGFLNPKGEFTYTCSLVTFDHQIDNPNADPLPQVALTQPYSTCGYLITEALLNNHQLSMTNLPFYYAGQHATCCLDVIRAKAALGGAKTSVAKQYGNLGLQIVDVSQPLPGFLLVANPHTLSTDTIKLLRATLLKLDPIHNLKDKKQTQHWGEDIRYGTIAIQAEDYLAIQQLVNISHIPEVKP